MGRFRFGCHGGHCGCHEDFRLGQRGSAWQTPMTRNEVVEDMEDYKAQLEAEITALEKRINSLKEK